MVSTDCKSDGTHEVVGAAISMDRIFLVRNEERWHGGECVNVSTCHSAIIDYGNPDDMPLSTLEHLVDLDQVRLFLCHEAGQLVVRTDLRKSPFFPDVGYSVVLPEQIDSGTILDDDARTLFTFWHGHDAVSPSGVLRHRLCA